jgi:hypothetical protein
MVGQQGRRAVDVERIDQGRAEEEILGGAPRDGLRQWRGPRESEEERQQDCDPSECVQQKLPLRNVNVDAPLCGSGACAPGG